MKTCDQAEDSELPSQRRCTCAIVTCTTLLTELHPPLSIPELPEFQKFKVVVIVWLAFTAITDTLIAVSLVWHLVSSALETPHERASILTPSLSGSKKPGSPPLTILLIASYGVRLQSLLCIFRVLSLALVVVTVQTGSITAVFAIVDMICFLASVSVHRDFPHQCASNSLYLTRPARYT